MNQNSEIMKTLKTWILAILCLSALPLIGQPQTDASQKVILTNEANINSANLEYSPAFFEDGIVFISSTPSKKRYKILDKRINENIMSIFLARRSEESGLLQNPSPFASELLTPVHEGPLTFDRTNDRMYFTRNNYKNGKTKKAKDGIVKLKIYEATNKDGKWADIKELKFNDDQSNTVHPSISVEGDMMYFASDRPGGFGGMDIYVSLRQENGKWGEPLNLGPVINTDGEEIFPHMHASGTLYFASTGHSGYGGLDLFQSNKLNNAWSKPQNLEKPFNTTSDDFGFIIDRDKKNGYFSTNREGGLGGDDIYSFYIAEENLDVVTGQEPQLESPIAKTVDILVIDHETGEPVIEAKVNYMNLDDLTIARAITSMNNQDQQNNENDLMLRLNMDENSKSGITDYDGKYPLKINNSNYVLNVEKDGYLPRLVVLTADSELSEILVSLKKGDPDAIAATEEENNEALNEVVSTNITEGTVFELPNIYYNFNDAAIRPDARIDLDALADFLHQYPDIEIELASHTDSRGYTRYNNRLSQRRADNVVRYLMTKGIGRERMLPVGHGETFLRNHCSDGVRCSEVEHQYNRRTEVKITKIDEAINIRFINKAPEESLLTNNIDSSSDNVATGILDELTGDFMVVAGVFKNKGNAEKRINQLLESGISTAEIVSFGNSSMYSVVVDRFSRMGDARAFSKSLKKNHGFRSFIRS